MYLIILSIHPSTIITVTAHLSPSSHIHPPAVRYCRDAAIKSASAGQLELSQVLSLQPGGDPNIALHAFPTASRPDATVLGVKHEVTYPAARNLCLSSLFSCAFPPVLRLYLTCHLTTCVLVAYDGRPLLSRGSGAKTQSNPPFPAPLPSPNLLSLSYSLSLLQSS